MSQYTNPPNLLRGISDDNVPFVTADDGKAQREDVFFLSPHQPQRMENVGYNNTFDGYGYHDQNHTGLNPGYMPTNYQYAPDTQFRPAPANNHRFGVLPQYDHSGNYQFQQQVNNGWVNGEVQRNGNEEDSECDPSGNAFKRHLLQKEDQETAKNEVLDDKTTSEESPEDSGSDFDPKTENLKRKSYSSRRSVTRKLQKRAVSPSDDDSISHEETKSPKNFKKVLNKKSKFVSKTKARNYKLKTEEERQRDPDYKLKRDRNNDAVRKSRKKSKEMEIRRMEEMERLKEENKSLRSEVTILKSIPCTHCGHLPIKTEVNDEDF